MTEFTVLAYNQLARTETVHIRVPVRTERWRVTDLATSEVLTSQAVPIPDEFDDIPGRHSDAEYEIVFLAQIPALSTGRFLMESLDEKEEDDDGRGASVYSEKTEVPPEGVWIGGGRLFVDGKGMPAKIKMPSGKEVDFQQTYHW